MPELGRSLVDELLEPTRIYARDCLALIDAVDVHAFSHVTGGGLAANLARVLPAGLGATVDRATWSPAPVFGLVGDVGGVAVDELERTLNMGVGMVAVVAADDADRAVRAAHRPRGPRLGARHRGAGQRHRRRPGQPPGLTGTSTSDTAPLDAANGCWVR